MSSSDSIFQLVARATDFSTLEQPPAETAAPRRAQLRVVEPLDPRPVESWGYMNGMFKLSDRGVCFGEEDKDGHPRVWRDNPRESARQSR